MNSAVSLSNVPPPLPPGWTEHMGEFLSHSVYQLFSSLIQPTVGAAPGGIRYYYNGLTKESTYTRPLPLLPGQSPAAKEKPAYKLQIPGTDWLRVTTTAGNIFYTNKAKKESVWTIPDEIKDEVAALKKEEAERARVAEEKAKAEEIAQVEKVKKDVEALVAKRKSAPESELVDEVVSKKARVEDGDENDGDSEEDEEDDSEDDEEEEDWQKEAEAQLAAEAEEHEKKQREAEEAKRAEEEELKRREKEKGTSALSMPSRVDLSIDEAKALFKVYNIHSFTHAFLDVLTAV